MIMGPFCGFSATHMGPPGCWWWDAMEAWQARDGGVAQLAGIIGAATDPVH
jgi:hypothetical protein